MVVERSAWDTAKKVFSGKSMSLSMAGVKINFSGNERLTGDWNIIYSLTVWDSMVKPLAWSIRQY